LFQEEIPEVVLRTVRLSITCKDPPESVSLRVKIGVLIRGMTDGVEHVAVVKERIHHFDHQNTVNILLSCLLPIWKEHKISLLRLRFFYTFLITEVSTSSFVYESIQTQAR